MRKFIAGVAVTAMVAVGVASATGQGPGGTVGPGAVGTKTFEVRVKESQINVNCGLDKQRQCFRRGPRIGNVLAGSGRIYDGDTRVGTAVFGNIVGRVRGNSTQDVFLASILFDNIQDTMSFMGPTALSGENAPVAPYAIVGGTGAYAGARGTVVEGDGTEGPGNEFRIPLNLTFIP